MKTADQFHPGDQAGTSYGDVSGVGADAVGEDAVAGGEIGGGEAPQDESAFDEQPSAGADEPTDGGGDDIYANPPVDPTSAVTDGEGA